MPISSVWQKLTGDSHSSTEPRIISLDALERERSFRDERRHEVAMSTDSGEMEADHPERTLLLP